MRETIDQMNVRAVRAAVLALFATVMSSACSNPFAPQYEYEEQVYLSVDGQATVVIDSSFAALVALRGGAIDPAILTAADRNAVKQIVSAAGCSVDSVSRFWTRSGRRFVQIQVSAADVRELPKCKLLAWSTYAFGPVENAGLRYEQQVSAPSPGATIAETGAATWDGNELVAFKLHLPSRITYQNVKLLNGENGGTERGNILTWAQTLTDRRAGKPVSMRADMDSTSILHTTLWLFAGAFAGAVGLLLLIIWLVVRKGRKLTTNN
jgi:hypothetical protein